MKYDKVIQTFIYQPGKSKSLSAWRIQIKVCMNLWIAKSLV